MKTISTPGGTITLAESKAVCPHCEAHLPIEKVEKPFLKSAKSIARIKCYCRKLIGIQLDYRGDFRAFKL